MVLSDHPFRFNGLSTVLLAEKMIRHKRRVMGNYDYFL